MTNRALVLAALATSPTTIRNPLSARDTELMVAALRALGAVIGTDQGDWLVTPGRRTGRAQPRADDGAARRF